MNFTDFLYDVFILKSYETKSYVERNREGREKGREWVIEENSSHSKKMHHKIEYYQAPDPRNYSRRAHLQRTSEQDRHCPL